MAQSFTISQLLAKNVHDARLKMKMTQQELAEATNITPLSISNIERAETWPKAETIDALAQVLHKRPFELFLDSRLDTVVSKETFTKEINMLIKELNDTRQRFENTFPPEDFSITHSKR